MSVRENIQIFHKIDLDAYSEALRAAFGASKHPTQLGCYLIDNLPYYKPRWIEDHISVLGFNYLPLPGVLIEALASLSELLPDEVLIRWTIEQELLFETTMGEVRGNNLPL